MIADDIIRLNRLKRNLIPEKREDSRRLKELAEAATVSYEKIGSSSGGSDNLREQKNTDYANCTQELKDLEAERDLLTSKIMMEFNGIFNSDDKKRRLAKLYYIDMLPLKTIANKRMHYAYGTLRNELTEINDIIGLHKSNDTK